LVKLPGKRPFIATMPAPGTYAIDALTTTEMSAPEPVEGQVAIGDGEDDFPASDFADPDTALNLQRLEFALTLDSETSDSFPDFQPERLPEQGLALLGYVFSKGQKYTDPNGWMAIVKLRDNWGRNCGLNTEDLKRLLHRMNQAGAGEFHDDTETEWRPRIPPKDLPKSARNAA
jgi:hypothetical protein